MTHSPYRPPNAHFHTHTHTSTYTRRAEMAKWELALCWRTRRSQVMIHLPEQVTAEHLWLTLMTITAAGMRGSRLSALSSVWRERRERKERQWGNAGASFVSTLDGFQQKCNWKPFGVAVAPSPPASIHSAVALSFSLLYFFAWLKGGARLRARIKTQSSDKLNCCLVCRLSQQRHYRWLQSAAA